MLVINFLALLFLILSTVEAQAGFLVPIVFGAAFAATTAGLVVTAAANIALSVGLSYLASRFLSKPSATGGVELDMKIEPDVPQSVLLGRATTAGSRFYGESFGSNNKNYVEGISLADHPCEGLVSVFVDGQPEGWVDSGHANGIGNIITSYSGGGHDWLYFKFYDGSQTTTDAYALNNLSGHNHRPWLSSMVGRGITYVRTTSQYHKTRLPFPLKWRFVVDGLRLYDPRKDSTVPGGSGTHRWDDLSTHEFSTNLVLQAYNILRGIRVLDHQGNPRHLYGLENTPAESLPLDVWFAALNEADVLVDGRPQFHGGGEVKVNVSPLDTVRELIKACDGRFVEVGGIYKVYVGEPGLPILSIDDGMIEANNPDVFRPIWPLEQRVNYVTGKYLSPTDGWVPKIAPPRESVANVVLDGRRIPGDLDAPFIQNGEHMQQIMQQMLNRARKERRHQIPLPPECWGLEPGDVISWTSQRNGYIDKEFVVDAVEDGHDLSIRVSIIEIDETDYDWSPTDLIPEADGSLITDRPPPVVIAGFSAEGYLHQGNNDTSRPAIRLFWTPPDDSDLIAVEVEFRRPTQPSDKASAHSNEPESGQLIILSGLAPNTEYEVRARFQSFEGKEVDWSLWIPVTTPAAGAVSRAEFDAELEAMVKQLDAHSQNSLSAALEWQREQVSILSQKVADIWASLDGQLQDYQQVIGAKAENTRIDLAEEIQARVDVTGAQASSIRKMESSVTQLNDGVIANSTYITGLLVSVDDAELGVAANSSAISILETEVSTIGSTVDAHSLSITSLESDITSLQGDVSGNSSAISSLSTRVTAAEGTITSHSSSITTLESDVTSLQTDTNANAAAIAGLDTRVTSAEGDISVISSEITILEANIGDNNLVLKGTFTSDLDIGLWTGSPTVVATSGTTIPYSHALRLTASGFEERTPWAAKEGDVYDIEAWINAANLSAGDVRFAVRHQDKNGATLGNTLNVWDSTGGTALTSVEAPNWTLFKGSTVEAPAGTVEGKPLIILAGATGSVDVAGIVITKRSLRESANASAISLLEATVNDSDTGVVATSTLVTELLATSAAGTAKGNIRFIAQSAPTGVAARYAIEASADDGVNFYQAGIYLDVLSGTGSRITFDADFLRFITGTGHATPFAIDGDTITMTGSVKIVGTLNLVDASVDTLQIAEQATTEIIQDDGAGGGPDLENWLEIISWTVDVPSGTKVLVQESSEWYSPAALYRWGLHVRWLLNGVAYDSETLSTATNDNPPSISGSRSRQYIIEPATGVQTYSIEASRSGSQGPSGSPSYIASVVVQVVKR